MSSLRWSKWTILGVLVAHTAKRSQACVSPERKRLRTTRQFHSLIKLIAMKFLPVFRLHNECPGPTISPSPFHHWGQLLTLLKQWQNSPEGQNFTLNVYTLETLLHNNILLLSFSQNIKILIFLYRLLQPQSYFCSASDLPGCSCCGGT